MSKLTIMLLKNGGELKEQSVYNEDNLLIFNLLLQTNYWKKYYYDKNNKLIKTIDSNNTEINIRYDKNIKTTFINGEEYEIVEYGDNGNRIKTITHVADDCDRIRIYQYDDKNNNIYEKHKFVFKDGRVIDNVSVICNVFDTKNNMVTSTNTVKNTMTTYKYDDKNNLIERKDNDNTILKYEYDGKDRKIYVKNIINKEELFYEYIEL